MTRTILLLFFITLNGPTYALDIQCPLGSYMKELKEGEKVTAKSCGRNTKDGFVKHGPAVELFQNGNRKVHANYENGKLSGTYMKWNSEGKLLYKATYEQGVLRDKKKFQ